MGQSAMLEANKKIKKFLQDPTKMEWVYYYYQYHVQVSTLSERNVKLYFGLMLILKYSRLRLAHVKRKDKEEVMDDLRFRKIFNLGITKDISGKKLSKLEKLQILVPKCCKIRKI